MHNSTWFHKSVSVCTYVSLTVCMTEKDFVFMKGEFFSEQDLWLQDLLLLRECDCAYTAYTYIYNMSVCVCVCVTTVYFQDYDAVFLE